MKKERKTKGNHKSTEMTLAWKVFDETVKNFWQRKIENELFFLGGVEEMEKQKIMKEMVAGKSPIISQIQNLRLNGCICGEEKC